jgi:hypothetical protein
MDRNEGYQSFVQALAQRGYRSTWQLGTIAEGMTVDCYLGGRLSPLLVLRYWRDDHSKLVELTGWDVYAPLTTSNQVDDTIKALEEQPADLTVLPTGTVERVVDALNALLKAADSEVPSSAANFGRAALREIATEIGKNR